MTAISFKRFAALALVAVSAVLTGCAQIKLGAPVASVDNIQRAKAIGSAPVSLGDFKAGAAVKDDAGLDIRSNTLSSPVKGSFAEYLKENLAVELRAAGLLDPASKTVVSGELVESKVNAGSSAGVGSLGARFVVTRAGAKVFEKELRVQAAWESSFVGATAIPAAINNYSALYRQLIAKLLDDAAFRQAIKT
jgi:hypothetical protein